MNFEDSDSLVTSEVEMDPQPLAKRRKRARAINWKKSISVACRAIAVKSPAASRAALNRHRGFINPELVKILETVGGYDIEECSTPLHESVRQGDVDTTQYLIAAGANIYAYDKSNGMKPLDLAADDACRTLLEHHAYILSTLKKDPAALVSAATAHCAFLSAPKKSLPASSLSLRPYHLDPSFLWAPLEASCSIFKWARDAFVAQVAASTKAYAKLPDDCAGDILEFLQVAMTRTESLHVTEHCSSPKARDWVRAVFDAAMAGALKYDLFYAAEDGNFAIVKDCLAQGANAEEADKYLDGYTPLINASVHGKTDIVELLLRAGADVDAQDESGATSLIKASMSGYDSTVKVLLDAGADVDARDYRDGNTALIWASEYGHDAVVGILLEAGANVNAKNEDGVTALMHASTCCFSDDVVEVLVRAGADKEARDKGGETALMRAARICSSTDTLEILLRFGADKDAKNEKDGKTALDYARAQNDNYMTGYTTLMYAAREDENVDVVEILLRFGADKEANNEGRTALEYAKLRRTYGIVALLER